MATTGTILAKNMSLYVGTTTPVVITCQVNASIDMSTNMFNTTCKDSGSWAANQPGVRSWNASVEGNVADDATYGFDELFEAWAAGTAVPVVFGTGVTGDTRLSGSTYISNLKRTSSGSDEAVTFTCELTGNGALTKAAYS